MSSNKQNNARRIHSQTMKTITNTPIHEFPIINEHGNRVYLTESEISELPNEFKIIGAINNNEPKQSTANNRVVRGKNTRNTRKAPNTHTSTHKSTKPEKPSPLAESVTSFINRRPVPKNPERFREPPPAPPLPPAAMFAPRPARLPLPNKSSGASPLKSGGARGGSSRKKR